MLDNAVATTVDAVEIPVADTKANANGISYEKLTIIKDDINEELYDLLGRRIKDNPAKGVYVNQKGEKVIIK
ncbi:MAG: hypothetical protein ACI30V_08930 [Muribaculaceae bacterium]